MRVRCWAGMVLALAEDELLAFRSPPVAPRRSAHLMKAAVVAVDSLALLLVQGLVLLLAGSTSRPMVAVIAASGPVWLLSVAHHHLYRTRCVRESHEEHRRLLRAGLTSAAVTIALAG
ncbi:MAG: hypothetical protein JWN29_2321, partial [Acidimicrobiales bacterium]|nr:hypothetical protein [Acidimicrobiales bacterium]